jgi:fumarate hydratase subunit alpha
VDHLFLEIVPDSSNTVISFLPKGGGAENMSKLFMLSPSTGMQDIIPRVCDALKDAGGNPCPPVILGIGIGGDATKCMYLAKKALLRPQKSRNNRPEIAKLEEALLSAVNQLNIGVMGLGGNSNCLDVRIEYTMRHPASFPVGMVVQCYCHRTLSMQITSDGIITFGHLNRDFIFTEEGQ